MRDRCRTLPAAVHRCVHMPRQGFSGDPIIEHWNFKKVEQLQQRDSPTDTRPQGNARRKRSSSLQPKLNILSERRAEVKNTSAFGKRRGQGDGRGRGWMFRSAPSGRGQIFDYKLNGVKPFLSRGNNRRSEPKNIFFSKILSYFLF